MREYSYRGYTIRRTEATHASTRRPLYEIDDMKPAGTRPFITTIADAREFIRDAIEAGYYIDGAGRTHPIKPAK